MVMAMTRSGLAGASGSGLGVDPDARRDARLDVIFSRTCIFGTMLAVALASFDSPAAAGPVPGDDFAWVTVGAPGNEAFFGNDPGGDVTGRGRVNHRYRIMKTQVAYRDWVEFSTAYRPYFNGQDIVQFEGVWGYWNSSAGRYETPDFARNWGAEVGFEYAARYANWLHNGKVSEQWAFENGAYDTSTFTRNPDGTANHAVHNQDARYWIPTLDEYMKAAYYDPHKDGVGGWWTRPNGSDNDLIMALPEDGGETYGYLGRLGGGDGWFGGWDLGQYPGTQSPWGMLDVSGALWEWTESPFNLNRSRLIMGSSANSLGYADFDMISYLITMSVSGGIAGFRLASPIPAPWSIVVVSVFPFVTLSRRRSK